MNTLAIDIGGTKLAAALVSDEHIISQRIEVSTPASPSPSALKSALASLIKPYQGKAQRVAVASTGIIDKGILTALNPDNLGGLNQFPLQEAIEELTGLPCKVLNDAQAAAWAEYTQLSTAFKNMTFITISTGVGGGIIVNGELLIGSSAFAGHVGHFQADPLGPVCGCGRIGCVEAIASGRAIAKAASGKLQGNDARTIFNEYRSGDAAAQVLVTRSVNAICHLIADIKALLDTECVVLGGSIGLTPGYLQLIEQQIKQLPPAFHVPVRAAYYQHDAGLMGAALWLEHQLSECK